MSKSSANGKFREIKLMMNLFNQSRNSYHKNNDDDVYTVFMPEFRKLFVIEKRNSGTKVWDFDRIKLRTLKSSDLCGNDLIMWVIDSISQ